MKSNLELVRYEEKMRNHLEDEYEQEINRVNINSIECLDIEKAIYKNTHANDGLNPCNDNVETILGIDLYNLLYKDKPVIRDLKSMKEPYDILNNIIRKCVKSYSFEEFKRNTTLNSAKSLIASQFMQDEITAYYRNLLNAVRTLEVQQNNTEYLKNSLECKKDIYNKTNDDSLKEEIEELENTIQERQETYLEEAEKLNTLNEKCQQKTSPDLIDSISNICNQRLNNAQKLFNSAGVEDYEDNLEQLNAECINKLSQMLLRQDSFNYLFDMLGKTRDIAVKFANKKNDTNGYVAEDVITGNNIANLLPSQLTILANEKTKKTFYKNYSEKNLLQYEKSDALSQGPVIICRDCSGSMTFNNRCDWATAMCVAMYHSAKHQKRDLRIVDFSDIVNYIDYLAKDNDNTKAIIDICSRRFSGGTNFSIALKTAFNAVNVSRFENADIVFITDGEDNISKRDFSNFLNTKKKKKVNMYTIYIGAKNISSVTCKELNSLSDEIYCISDNELKRTGDNSKIKEVFKKISERR